jgi:hypothetical protein
MMARVGTEKGGLKDLKGLLSSWNRNDSWAEKTICPSFYLLDIYLFVDYTIYGPCFVYYNNIGTLDFIILQKHWTK